MIILGISAYYHDSSAVLLINDKIIAAAQEERFTRKKHDSAFPANAIQYCLEESAISINDVDHITFYEKPLVKFERLLETYLSLAPVGFMSFSRAIPVWLKEKLFQKIQLRKSFEKLGADPKVDRKFLFAEHHQSHAASAFFPSPFDRAAVVTADGVGEWATTSVALGEGANLDLINEIYFPHSLGLLYSAFTYFTGFRVNSGEYKVMGLAPYGEPRFAQKIMDHLIDLKDDGSFRLNMDYFEYASGLRMTGSRFENLFDVPTRKSGEQLCQVHMDLAASVQSVIEDAMLRLVRYAVKITECRNLCLAGGVALNCVSNGKIYRSGVVDNIWVQPAAGDAGGALGAAFATHHTHLGNSRTKPATPDSMLGSYLGPSFSQPEIEAELNSCGASYKWVSDEDLFEITASALVEGQAIGWFQGRMEFGPRALGNRSIIGDARSPSMQKNLNLKVKFRESFRPFAPSVLYEDMQTWFNHDAASPYMLMVADVKEDIRIALKQNEQSLFGIEKLNVSRSEIPAVTHVDYSARIQSVHKDVNPRYHRLISTFKEKTGCPVIANTSFNVRGEPIVCSPKDAFRCFMGTDLDMLVVENFILIKNEQNQELAMDYKNTFELD